MAYNVSERFQPNPKTYRIFEPGAYQNTNSSLVHPNKVPFLSKTPRKTEGGQRIWTHAIYYAERPRAIPNCTSISSKVPRFPYEFLCKEDIESIICQCEINATCECHNEEEAPNINKVVCQAKVPRRIFKGATARSILGDNVSSSLHILGEKHKYPPFYNTVMVESHAYYHGWKWSKWTSKRVNKAVDFTPGPADYKIENYPSFHTICNEKVRSMKRKNSQQLRFMDMVEKSNKLENLPGPATYNPIFSQGTKLNFIGPKAERFSVSKYNEIPGPTRYYIKRDFEKYDEPIKFCRVKFKPAAFGVKAIRFKNKPEEGPSPASYSSNCIPSYFRNCVMAPFNSSAKRFKDDNKDIDTDDDIRSDYDITNAEELMQIQNLKALPTWQFRSKTIRMKAATKQQNEPSPADFLQPLTRIKRELQIQHTSPFFSSEPRLQAWYNWIPVHGKEKSPGPGYYNLDKPKCMPAVHHGPICRYPRFENKEFQTPAPNTYNTRIGIENILYTHNEKLKHNVENKPKFHWRPPVDKRPLGIEEKENILLNKCISLLDTPDVFEVEQKKLDVKPTIPSIPEQKDKPKLLRCFVYNQGWP